MSGDAWSAWSPELEETEGEEKFQVNVIRCSDQELEGTLCQVYLRESELVAYVNGDYPLVRDALMSDPPNRPALELLLIGEIADLVDRRLDLLERIFSKKEIATIMDRNPLVRRGYIFRLLLDRLRQGALV